MVLAVGWGQARQRWVFVAVTITRHGIVHVTDGGTRLYEAAVTPRDWIAFRACLALHRWSKEKAA
jgi:hypothetical protein